MILEFSARPRRNFNNRQSLFINPRSNTRSCQHEKKESSKPIEALGCSDEAVTIDYFLRCRILARIRRFLRPNLRRPLPVFLVPTRLDPCFGG